MVEQVSALCLDHLCINISKSFTSMISDRNTMGCPPVNGDNPQVLRSDYLSYRWTPIV